MINNIWLEMIVYAFSIIGAITFFIIFYGLFFQKITKGYDYHKEEKDKEVMELRVMTTMTYAQIRDIINVIWDLHKEIDRPLFFRLWGYPEEAKKESHLAIYKELSNCLSALDYEIKNDIKPKKQKLNTN